MITDVQTGAPDQTAATEPSIRTSATPVAPDGTVAVYTCDACELASHTYPARTPEGDGLAVIAALVGVHNDLHHDRWPIARPVQLPAMCESCQHAPTAAAVYASAGVVPFAVCTGCRTGATGGAR